MRITLGFHNAPIISESPNSTHKTLLGACYAHFEIHPLSPMAKIYSGNESFQADQVYADRCTPLKLNENWRFQYYQDKPKAFACKYEKPPFGDQAFGSKIKAARRRLHPII